MKLLFDQNLPPGLTAKLIGIFPDSVHVGTIGLRQAPDELIWSYALAHGLAIVSKDGDFHQMSRIRGAPPKIMWLRLGNCSTKDIERVLRTHANDIIAFGADPHSTILVIE